ncbi:peptidylprolyl isomerase [bacterium]|nr:peptidylprolyl isomerase [bacterium]
MSIKICLKEEVFLNFLMGKDNNTMNLYTLLAILITALLSCSRTETPQNHLKAAIENNSVAVFKTNKGTIRLHFYQQQAPNTCKRMKELIAQGFYNGQTFHRVIPGYIIQTGEPASTGADSSNLKIKDEVNTLQHIKGVVAMAKQENTKDSADTQFYIALNTLPDLDSKFTIFAKVVEGISILDEIVQGDKILSAHLVEQK